MNPPWLDIALQDINLREIPGAPTHPKIAGWLKTLKAWWADDETPWCGTAVAAWMNQCAIPLPKHWYRAKGWLDWGVIYGPCVGCVVVFERVGGGHVGLVMGVNKLGHLMVLGGNQGNAVSIMPFDVNRVIGYRWPVGKPTPSTVGILTLPVLDNGSALSRNEA